MSESRARQHPTWPDNILKPGQPGWEASLTRWLDDQLPEDTWRHHALTHNPWAAVLTAAITIRWTLDGLRQDYVRAGEMRTWFGDQTAQQLRDAITTEATRLKRVLDELIVLEHALGPGGSLNPIERGTVEPGKAPTPLAGSSLQHRVSRRTSGS